MARIELRNTTILMKDGLAGTAAVDDMAAAMGDTSIGVDTVALNTAVTTKIPIGARFTVTGETGSPVHVVTARTPTSVGPTTSITFTPALASGVSNDAVITFGSQQIEIKIGEGDLTYTETDQYTYDLDRGELDTVRRGDDVPMEVSLAFTFEQVTTGTGEAITPVDALKRINGAAEWVSSSDDLCEPYAVDIEVIHEPPCGTAQVEEILFPDFRAESRQFSFRDAQISVTGRCNATEPTVTRS
jgi:hypothetical protein